MTNPQAGEFERIRGYLQTQAGKLTIPELADKVRSDMEQVHSAIASVPAGSFHRKPADGEWCADEVLSHLVATSRDVAQAITSVLDSGAQPQRIPDQIRGTTESPGGEEWWQRLLSEREVLLQRVREASGNEHLGIVWAHPFFGDLNWREWLLFMRIHDLDHARQLQAITDAVAEG